MTCTVETNSKDVPKYTTAFRKTTSKGLFERTFYYTMFCSSRSEPQTYVTNANSIDGGPNIVHRPISPRHAKMPSCTVPLYCIQPRYSHYTARGSDVGGVGGSTWEPQRSGAVRATSGSTPNVLYNGVPGSTSGSTPNVLYNGSRMVRW